jgi:hypothetical protein
MTYNQYSVFVSPITDNDDKCVIHRLKGSLSAGFYDVPEATEKHCVQFITIPLIHIFNLSFLTGYFADILKVAKIQPIFKKSDEQDMKNHGLVSILSVFSKILKKLTFNQLNLFVEKHNFLPDAQHGFRGGRSMETTCKSCIESTLEVMDSNLNAVVIFLDLSKAYDVLNHQILLEKLEIYGVREVLKSWFKSCYQIVFNLLKSQKLVIIIPFIDTLPCIKKQLTEFLSVQH